MPVSYELVVCITSTALFDCSESHNIWLKEGREKYKQYQREHVTEPFKPGVGFRLAQSLLNLNKSVGKELIDVILVSRNDSESGERVRNSISHHNLGITRMSFTNGTDVTTYLQAWGCDLFLSTEEKQVRTVLSPNAPSRLKGIAAGLVCNIIAETTGIQLDDSLPSVVNTPDVRNENMFVNTSQWPQDQVRIVFDGDGVLFSDEAERIYQTQGLESFRKSEQEKLHIALPEGPMHAFALKLQKVRNALGNDDKWRIRTFLVTARNGIANERALKTLEKWGLEIDETHFLGGLNKTPFLVVIDPVIFFDDSREHINRAKQYVPAAHIVYGIQNVIVDVNGVDSTTTTSSLVSNEVEANTDDLSD